MHVIFSVYVCAHLPLITKAMYLTSLYQSSSTLADLWGSGERRQNWRILFLKVKFDYFCNFAVSLTNNFRSVLFICAWSAALSLTFDNYFTSIIPCTGPSSISWYSSISLPESTIQDLEGGVGSRLCNTQLSLISLVLVGLLMYCINLIISLYRIFDKVKLSATSVRGARNASV